MGSGFGMLFAMRTQFGSNRFTFEHHHIMKHDVTFKKRAASGGLAAIAMLMSACSEEGEKRVSDLADNAKETAGDFSESTKAAFSNLKHKSAAAWSNFSESSYDKKGEAVSFLENQYDQVQVKLWAVKEDLAERADGAEDRIEVGLESLERKSEELESEIEKLSQATRENWGDLKAATRNKWQALLEDLDEIKADFD